MADVTWEYLAGLFDGEGSISYSGKDKQQLIISITQGEKNSWLINEIAIFLDIEDINYALDTRTINDSYQTRSFTRIIVSGIDAALDFLERIEPFLILKHKKCTDGISFLENKIEKWGHRIKYCKYGHERTPENVYINPKNGRRSCLVCRILRSRGIDPATEKQKPMINKRKRING